MAVPAIGSIPAMTAPDKIETGRSNADQPGFQEILKRSAESFTPAPPSSDQGKAQLEIIKQMAQMELMSLNSTLINALGGQGNSSMGDSGPGDASSGMLALLQVLDALRNMPASAEDEHREMDVPRAKSEKTIKTSQKVDEGVSTSVTLPPIDGDIDTLINWAADKHELDPALVRAVVKTESNFNPKAVSKAGAMGLMQLMPQTARDLGVDDAFNPAANVDGGARYLRQMLNKYDGDVDRALAAYNWGPGNLDKSTGYLPQETRNYIRIVNQHYQRFAEAVKESTTA